jgi:segregation and condensation protein B
MNEEVSDVTTGEQSGAEAEAPRAPSTGPLPQESERWALIEAVVYVAEEPLQPEQIAAGLGLPVTVVKEDLAKLIESYSNSSRGIEIRQVAGGCKMFTKAEHHDAVRTFVKSLQTKLRLSLPALETLSVIAYKQPITLPEIQAIRGVNAGGVVHTLLKHKLIAAAGRKKVVGKPMQYKTTREFLVQFGLDSVAELPNLNELEELSRAALGEEFEEQAQPTLLDAKELAAGNAIDSEPDSVADEQSREEQ